MSKNYRAEIDRLTKQLAALGVGQPLSPIKRPRETAHIKTKAEIYVTIDGRRIEISEEEMKNPNLIQELKIALKWQGRLR